MSDANGTLPSVRRSPDGTDGDQTPEELQLARFSLDRAGDAVYWIDPGGRFVYVNDTAAQMLGYAIDELHGMTMADIDPEVEREAWPRIWEKIKRRQAYTFEASHRAKDGRIFPIEVSVYFLAYDGHEFVCSFVRDITKRRQAEAALQAAKERADLANTAKTRFLAAASHDLRQPLHAMELLVSALAGRTKDPDSLSIIANMQDSLSFTQRLLDSLLNISELEAGAIRPHLEDVPLSALLPRIHQQYVGIAQQKALGLRLVRSSAVVRSDPGLLERILDNFVSNAVQHTNEGRVLLGCRRAGGALRLEVWDSGPGIPEDGRTAIFEDFCQLDSGAKERGAGLGLGLGIVRRVAELLDHPIGVRSTPGKGSVFWVEVERVARAIAAAAPEAAAAPAGLPGEALEVEGATILVVEDDAMVLNAMRTVLEAWGYRVAAVATAEEARCAQVAPDMVIADFRLPGGETGDQAIAAVRQRCGRDLPGIIVTGDIAPEGLPDLEASRLHLLKKPVRPAKLRALMRHLLQG